MTDDVPTRRSVLATVAAATSGCVSQMFNRSSVVLTGIRLHNWTNERTTVRVRLFRQSERVLDEQVSLAPLGESESVASFTPEWSVETARYRVRLELIDGDATLERQLPPSDFSWDGCAYIDADLENGRDPGRTVGPDAKTSFEMHLQEVVDPEDFSSDHCPNQ